MLVVVQVVAKGDLWGQLVLVACRHHRVKMLEVSIVLRPSAKVILHAFIIGGVPEPHLPRIQVTEDGLCLVTVNQHAMVLVSQACHWVHRRSAKTRRRH